MASTMFVLLAFLLGTMAVASSYPIVLDLRAPAQLEPFAQATFQELQSNDQMRAYAANDACDDIFDMCNEVLGWFTCIAIYVNCVST